MKTFLCLIISSLTSLCLMAGEPVAVYLTIQEKPDSTMTVCWVTSGSGQSQVLKYRDTATQQWYQVDVQPQGFPESYPYSLYTIELEELRADKRYEFILPETPKVYSFNTLPASLERPVKFVAGGDIYHDDIEHVENMNRIAALQDPDFALLGGDIAYSGSKFTFFKEEGDRWIQFLLSWSKTMIRRDGTLIPLITAIGNHDINGRYDQDSTNAAFYYFLFPTHSLHGYQVLDFGAYMSLWILNTGHTEYVDGAQTAWLEKTLQARKQVPFKLALYHVPAYPSARAYDNKRSTIVRSSWVPLFDKYGIKVAFENHDHAYKRTHLLKNGQPSAEGVLYVGDGAWGVDFPRLPKTPEQLWYLAFSAQKRHILLGTLTQNQILIQAIDPDGKVFDQVTVK